MTMLKSRKELMQIIQNLETMLERKENRIMKLADEMDILQDKVKELQERENVLSINTTNLKITINVVDPKQSNKMM